MRTWPVSGSQSANAILPSRVSRKVRKSGPLPWSLRRMRSSGMPRCGMVDDPWTPPIRRRCVFCEAVGPVPEEGDRLPRPVIQEGVALAEVDAELRPGLEAREGDVSIEGPFVGTEFAVVRRAALKGACPNRLDGGAGPRGNRQVETTVGHVTGTGGQEPRRPVLPQNQGASPAWQVRGG